MRMEAGLNWHRALLIGIHRYENGGWNGLAQNIA
jgi:hypothetical protein